MVRAYDEGEDSARVYDAPEDSARAYDAAEDAARAYDEAACSAALIQGLTSALNYTKQILQISIVHSLEQGK